jgi:hypothetical protein
MARIAHVVVQAEDCGTMSALTLLKELESKKLVNIVYGVGGNAIIGRYGTNKAALRKLLAGKK